ncbi:MAG TPA: hypothetical protein VGC95_08220, partial [Chitinophagaceae bacterium]
MLITDADIRDHVMSKRESSMEVLRVGYTAFQLHLFLHIDFFSKRNTFLSPHMSPSFYNLFKRGKYCSEGFIRSGDGPEEKEAKERKRKDAERFAVSAIAFCLKHDKNFQQEFFHTVCWKAGDPELDPNVNISVEENAWADLKIINKEFLYVVEFKIHAKLEDRQNPNKDDFWKKPGYGYEIKQNQGCQYRYTVLGYKDQNGKGLGLGQRIENGVLLSECAWSTICSLDLEKRGPLTKDLFICLANL